MVKNTKTVVLYECPVAFEDVKSWVAKMVAAGKVTSVKWPNQKRPIVTLFYEKNKEQVCESVYCYPIQDLALQDNSVDPNYDKLVVFGSISEPVRPQLIEFLQQQVTK